jgi:hypothetical protein
VCVERERERERKMGASIRMNLAPSSIYSEAEAASVCGFMLLVYEALMNLAPVVDIFRGYSDSNVEAHKHI